MIAAEIISATLGDNSMYRFSRENNLLNWNNSSVKNLRIVVYRKTRTGRWTANLRSGKQFV